MSRKRIIVVEDDLVVLKVLSAKLSEAGYQVVEATDANEAIHAAQEQKPDLMILDLTLVTGSELNGITDGFGLLYWLRYTLTDSKFPVIVNTADTSPNIEARASACQIYAVFRKGDSLNELLVQVRNALNKTRQQDLITLRS